MVGRAVPNAQPRQPGRPRVLFIAYTFPPVGGAGVQRTTKFIKYLPQFGWDATVLTVSNASVPVADGTLCQDVPSATRIIRARTFEPSYATKRALVDIRGRPGAGTAIRSVTRRLLLALLQPDPQILWNVPAFRAGVRAVREVRHDVIVASGPPFSSLLLGAALSRYLKIPLVLDYRDEWDVSQAYWENRRPGHLSVALQRAMEGYALRRAKVVVATSPPSAAALSTLCRSANSAASVTHIYNGFDPDDFASAAPEPRASDGLWRLVYTGTLYHLMSPEPLVQAIEALAATRPELAARIELVFAGRRTPAQDQRIGRLSGLCRLHTRDYVSHREAIALARSADALCVLLSDLPGAGRVVPAKLFEYMASRKPILAIAPHGAVWELLRSHPAAFTYVPDAVADLRDWIAESVAGAGRSSEATFDIDRYDRRHLAQQLAAVLAGAVNRAPTTGTEAVECSG